MCRDQTQVWPSRARGRPGYVPVHGSDCGVGFVAEVHGFMSEGIKLHTLNTMCQFFCSRK